MNKCTQISKIFFEPMPDHNEEYVVVFWQPNEAGYWHQVKKSLFTSRKDSHALVSETIMRTYHVSRENIVSVKYQ